MPIIIEINSIESYILKDDAFLCGFYAIYIKQWMDKNRIVEITDDILNKGYLDYLDRMNNRQFVFLSPRAVLQKLIKLELLEPIEGDFYELIRA